MRTWPGTEEETPEFDGEMSAYLKTNWGQMVDESCSIRLPIGWQSMVDNMLFEINLMTGIKRADSMYVSYGALVTDILITKRGGKTERPLEVTDKYRLSSQKTCFECGGPARRKIIGKQIYVLCKQCESDMQDRKKAEAEGKTGTWLDKF